MIGIFKIFLKPTYYRSILMLSKVSLQSQYRNSFLGMLWSVIAPAIMITVMALAFSMIMRLNVQDYALYLMSGMLAWNMMFSIVTTGGTSLQSRGDVLKRSVLPKTMFPFSDAIVHIYLFFISFIAMQTVVGVFVTGFVHWTVVLLPLAMAPLVAAAVFASLAMAYLTPYLRDVGHLVTVILNAFYWATPIIYQIEMIPEDKKIFFELNPFYILIRPIQDVVYYGRIPGVYEMGTAICIALLVMLASAVICSKLRRNIIYYL